MKSQFRLVKRCSGAGRLLWYVRALPVVGALLLTACDLSTMAFVKDERVQILAPADRNDVTLPMTVRWEVEDFDITGRDGQSSVNAGYFAVFIDRDPIPPGKTLEWLAKQDNSCGQHACGTVGNLGSVYPTSRTSLTLEQLPAISSTHGVERHEAVIILLDGNGARIGESAFYVRFNFERSGR